MIWDPLTLDPRPGPLLHVASGLLLVALAVFVASVKPRRRANLAFAGFSAGWGLSVVAEWTFRLDPGLVVVTPESGWLLAANAVAFGGTLLAAACLPLVALWFPRRLSPAEHASARIAAGGAGAFCIAVSTAWIVWWEFAVAVNLDYGMPALTAHVLVAGDVGRHVARVGGTVFALLLLALRARIAQREGRDAEGRLYVLMTVALLLQPGVNAGIMTALVPLTTTTIGVGVLARYVTFCALAAIWLSNARPGPAPAARAARNVALLAVALPLAGWALITLFTDVIPVGSPPGIGGAARTLTVLILAYAIVRHQLLGIDVKVRWGISRGTIAAAFVAVFFVAGEGAQIVFGQGNEWIGLLSAGALVFALAPLQRAADRLAEKAVPVDATTDVPAGPGSGGPDPERAYLNALRLALKDRRLSRDEEVHLAELAEALGIGAGRAAALVREAERERESEVVP